MEDVVRFVCQRQEQCELVLAACERYVKAESKLNVLQEKYNSMSGHANKMYSLGKRLIIAQETYFKNRTQENLIKSKQAEKAFKDEIQSVSNLHKPQQLSLGV